MSWPLTCKAWPSCSGYHYCISAFIKAWTQVLDSVKSYLRRVGDSRWWGSLTVAPSGNKARHLSSFNYTTKTIHRRHHKKLPDKKAKVNLKIYDVTGWTANNYNTYIAQYLKKQSWPDNEIRSVNRIIECNIVNILFWKMIQKLWRRS